MLLFSVFNCNNGLLLFGITIHFYVSFTQPIHRHKIVNTAKSSYCDIIATLFYFGLFNRIQYHIINICYTTIYDTHLFYCT